MSALTEHEVVAIAPQLWSLEGSQRPGEELLTGKALIDEIMRRILLVGPLLRYIVSWKEFEKRVREIDRKVTKVVTSANVFSVIVNELQEESGKLQTTWVDYSEASDLQPGWIRRQNYKSEFIPLALYLLENQKPKILDDIREKIGPSALGGIFEPLCGQLLAQGGSFKASNLELTGGDLVTKSKSLTAGKIEPVTMPRRESSITVKLEGKTITDSAYEALKLLEDDAGELQRMPPGFPLCDFAASRKVWFNSRAARSTSKINAATGLNFLRELGVVERATLESVEDMENFKAKLYYVDYDTAFSTMTLQGDEIERDLFLKHVDVYKLSVADSSMTDMLKSLIDLALKHYGCFDKLRGKRT
jgi:hypothetical protein